MSFIFLLIAGRVRVHNYFKQAKYLVKNISWFIACFLLVSQIICRFSPSTVWLKRRNIATILCRILRECLFIATLKRTNPIRKRGSYGNIFALSFKVHRMPAFSLCHQGFYRDSYVILRGERICKNPTQWYLHHTPSLSREQRQIWLQRAEKVRQRNRVKRWVGVSSLWRRTKIQARGGRGWWQIVKAGKRYFLRS